MVMDSGMVMGWKVIVRDACLSLAKGCIHIPPAVTITRWKLGSKRIVIMGSSSLIAATREVLA